MKNYIIFFISGQKLVIPELVYEKTESKMAAGMPSFQTWEIEDRENGTYKFMFNMEHITHIIEEPKPSTGESDSTSQSTNGESEVTDKESTQ